MTLALPVALASSPEHRSQASLHRSVLQEVSSDPPMPHALAELRLFLGSPLAPVLALSAALSSLYHQALFTGRSPPQTVNSFKAEILHSCR